MSDDVAWCELENAEYTADLDLWTGLCSPSPLDGSPAPTFGAETVLELGAGIGRVSAALCALGAEVWALDNRQELLDELVRRASGGQKGQIFPICADARSCASLRRSFDLVIAPVAFVQIFEARKDRIAVMQRAARHLAPDGHSSFWMTFHPDLDEAWADEADDPLPPQYTERGGRRFETYPLESYWHSHDGQRSLRIVWQRRADGDDSIAVTSYAELTVSEVEEEAAQAGLELIESIRLPGNRDFLDQLALRFKGAR